MVSPPENLYAKQKTFRRKDRRTAQSKYIPLNALSAGITPERPLLSLNARRIIPQGRENVKRNFPHPPHKFEKGLKLPAGTLCRARALPLPPLAPPLWGSSRRSRVRGAQGCAKSLPPGRGKVARPKAVTDEGAAIRRTASPPPSSAPVCALGHLPPGGWKAYPAGDKGGFAVCKPALKPAGCSRFPPAKSRRPWPRRR